MVDVADASVVAILTRAPSAGGKTRLFAGLGQRRDPALLEALLLDTIDGSRTRGVTQVVAVDPPDAIDEIRRLVPAGVQVIAQASGSLGDRMRQLMQHLLDQGAQAVVLIGSDLPEIEATVVVEALDALAADPQCLVLGPAADGGYYLIAATRVPAVFDGITWGGPAVLDETRAAADRAGVRVRLISALGDVDTAQDLDRLLAAGAPRGSRTAAWARRHTARAAPDENG